MTERDAPARRPADVSMTHRVITAKIDPVRYAIRIGDDVVRIVQQDEYDMAEAISDAFRQAKDDGVHFYHPSSGKLLVTVERIR